MTRARLIVRQAWRSAAKILARGSRLPIRVPVLKPSPASYTDQQPESVPLEYVEFTEHAMGFGSDRATQIRGTYNGQSFVCGGPTLAEFARAHGQLIEETEIRI